MKKSKILSALLSVIMTLTFVCSSFSFHAEENVKAAEVENDYGISGNDTFGKLISEEMAADPSSIDGETAESVVYSAEVNETTVTVGYHAVQDCTLLAAVFDDEGSKMLASGKTEVSAENSAADVTIDISKMPEYFCLRVYLIDTKTLKPLSQAYECQTYTKAMQEFLSKTTDDFETDRTFNFDNDKKSNFIVYRDEVKRIGHSDTVNTIVSADDDTMNYVIGNADSSVTSLAKDDLFVYETDDNHIYLCKVDTVSVKNGTAYITGQEVNKEDFFSFIKIETTIKSEEQEPQPEPAPSALDKNSYAPATYGSFEDNYELGNSVNIPFLKEDNAELTFSLVFDIKIQFYWAPGVTNVNVTCDFDIGFFVKAELKDKKGKPYEKKLTVFPRPVPVYTAGVVSLTIDPKFVLRVKGEINAKATMHMSGGVVTTSEGIRPYFVKPSPRYEGEIKASIFLGFDMGFGLDLGCKEIAEIGLPFEYGFEVEVSSNYVAAYQSDEIEKHDCIYCFDGKVYFKYEWRVEIEILGGLFRRSYPIIDKRIHFENLDFWFCLQHGDHGSGSCPRVSHRVIIETKEAGEYNYAISADLDITSTRLNYDNESYTSFASSTNAYGKKTLWLPDGEYNIEATAGDLIAKKKITVDGAPVNTLLLLEEEDEEEDEDEPKPAKPISSTPHSPAVGEDDVVVENVVYHTYYRNVKMPNGVYVPVVDYYMPKDYVGAPTDVTIVSSIGGAPVKGSINFNDSPSLRTVTILNNTDWCPIFSNCPNLVSVSLPSSFSKIPDGAFSDCTSLRNVNIPGSVTTIGISAFYGCTSLTGIYIPDSVTTIDNCAFFECKNLRSITIPDSVTTIGTAAFTGCKSLTGITIPNSVTVIPERGFMECTNLSNVILPDGLTTIGKAAFQECDSLEEISIPKTVTVIKEYAFATCPNLKDIGLTEGLKTIEEGAYINCKNLEEVVIPDSVTTLGDAVFVDCRKLRKAEIGKSVTKLPFCLFSGCIRLNEVTIGESVKTIEQSAFYETAIVDLVIPDSVTTIDNCAFAKGVGSIETLVLGKSLKDFSDAFARSDNLRELTISDGIKSIPDMAFFECTSLEEVDLGNTVTSIGDNAFRYSAIKSLNIPESVTSIGECAFANCSYLEEISIPRSVTSIIDNTFAVCPSLSDVYYGGTEEEWNTIINLGSYAFNDAEIHFMGETSSKKSTNTGMSNSDEEYIAYDPEDISVSDGSSFESTLQSEIMILDSGMAAKAATAENKDYPVAVAFEDLPANNICNLYILRSASAEDLLSADNLLCIGQTISGGAGYAGFNYILKEECKSPVFIVKAIGKYDISQAEATLDVVDYDGKEHSAEPVVTYRGKTLAMGKDYDLEGIVCTDKPGVYNINIVGCGSYTGKCKAVFEIYCDHNYENGVCTVCKSDDPDYEPPASGVMGDANNDGSLTVADLVALQKWVLGNSDKLEGWKNADLCSDGIINAFDIVMLRRLLIEKTK